MSTKISIDPITRLEGHGRIDIFLDDAGAVDDCRLVIPEIRGFEKFVEGRPVEELPRITPRICGVCPEAHHTASAKAVDAVYGVQIPQTAELIRRLHYNAFVAGDHATHFFALGGPDFIIGPDAPPAERNVIGVVRKVGQELAQAVIRMRREAHEVSEMLGGRRIHPVGMIAGGQSKAVTEEMRVRLIEIGEFMVEFGKQVQQIFADVVLGEQRYVDLILSEAFTHRTHYMALVNERGELDVFDGQLRVVDPEGNEVCRYAAADYLEHVSERVEPWTYLKFPYLKQVGWNGFVDGKDSGVYRVAPLGMLNAAEKMQTPAAQAEYEKLYDTLGGKPVHATLAYHWARIIEMLQSCELVLEHARDERLTDPNVRVIPDGTPAEGVGVVEAPRGILVHHYVTDDRGIVERANLIVGTTNNHAPIQLSVHKAAASLIEAGKQPDEALLNMIEMAFRAYDPCFGCATHALPGRMPLEVSIRSADGALLHRLQRGLDSGETGGSR
ncbi:MAG: Ni/Fe hydrogenase subunit alpha [Deltaproteobacteria bacterium]|nr:Ni/Fe hydrogenase subunit alpha [Deltaproteobacteria bacterium]